MKIKQNDYQELKATLKVISPTVRTRYRKEGLSNQRYVWDCLWFIIDHNGYIIDDLYDYMNDNHIETALFKIMGKY